MKVRTIRDHCNYFGQSYFKSGSAGPIYDVSDSEARRLIKFGFVEAADENHANRTKGLGQGAGRTTASDRAKHAPKGVEEGSGSSSKSVAG